MGFDVYGKKPTAPEGRYFRRNIWCWPPLVALCRDLAPDESRRCKHWDTTDGDGLNAKDALRLASRLSAVLEDGTVAKYLRRDHKEQIAEVRAKYEPLIRALDAVQGVTVVGPGPADDIAAYLTEDDVRKFVAFLNACGGFSIC